MQLAHPLVAAGVAEHSTFRDGPAANVKRLHSTVRAMLDLSFGSPEDIGVLSGTSTPFTIASTGPCARLPGAFSAGTPYSASDPELLIWVDATVRDSMLLAYELFVTPLSAADRDQFWAEGEDITTALRVPARCPHSVAGPVPSVPRRARGQRLAGGHHRRPGAGARDRVARRHARAVAPRQLAPCHDVGLLPGRPA